MKPQNSFSSFSCEAWDIGKGQGSCTFQALRVNDIFFKALKCGYILLSSIIRKMKILGYTPNEIVFVHCADDFVSPSIGLHACIPARV